MGASAQREFAEFTERAARVHRARSASSPSAQREFIERAERAARVCLGQIAIFVRYAIANNKQLTGTGTVRTVF